MADRGGMTVTFQISKGLSYGGAFRFGPYLYGPEDRTSANVRGKMQGRRNVSIKH